MSTGICPRCDMENCEHATGAGSRYDASVGALNVPRAGQRTGSGPSINARFNGHCKSCGRPYDAGDSITHSRDADGWIAECCS